MKRALIVAVLLVMAVLAGVFLVARTWYPDNVAMTTEDGGSKNLRTRQYSAPGPAVVEAVEDAIREMSTYGQSWRLVGSEPADGETRIRAEVPVMMFTDDLEVIVVDGGEEGITRVDVVSRSRVGKSDFGENARHVRKILSALDDKFQSRK